MSLLLFARSHFFKNWANPGLFFVYFRPFLIPIFIVQIQKAKMVCLGFKPAAAGWWAQTKPLSYCGRPRRCHFY